MKYKTNKIITPLVVTNCIVTTFKSYQRNTTENATLKKSINGLKDEGEKARDGVEVHSANVEKEAY